MSQTWELLVVEHTGLVRRVALRVAARLPSSIEVDDLVGVGNMALIDASKKFDGNRGVTFPGYAQHRIRGAMLDALNRRSSGMDYGFEMHEELREGSDEDDASGFVSSEASPEQDAAAAVLRRRLIQALACLTPSERYAIVARAEEHSYKEIGQHFERSITWAFAIVQSARTKMQRQLSIYRIDADAA